MIDPHFFLKLVCMIYAYMQVHSPMSVRVEVRGQYWVSSFIVYSLFFRTGSLTESGTPYIGYTGCPGNPRDPPDSVSPVLVLQACATELCFFMCVL